MRSSSARAAGRFDDLPHFVDDHDRARHHISELTPWRFFTMLPTPLADEAQAVMNEVGHSIPVLQGASPEANVRIHPVPFGSLDETG